jgi:hypothetical protein
VIFLDPQGIQHQADHAQPSGRGCAEPDLPVGEGGQQFPQACAVRREFLPCRLQVKFQS